MCKEKVTAPEASNKPCTISERYVLYKYKDFQHLPKRIADFVGNKKKILKPLRSRLIEQSFYYSIDEFLDYCVAQM
jgi:hypothetical protein